MHIGKSYRLSEFLVWTKRTIFILLFWGIAPVILYQVLHVSWVAIPWTIVGLFGTATAFIVGFKNSQSYNRIWEAQQIWVTISSNSKAWGFTCRDYLKNPAKSKEIIYRHIAWLTILRYQMRVPKVWESLDSKHNAAYRRFYCIPENEVSLEIELVKYLPAGELKRILNAKNPAIQVLGLQSKAIMELYDGKEIPINFLTELEKSIKEFSDLQGKCERIKNFPYPRQFSVINGFFINLFCFILPFGMLKEFDKLNESVNGFMHGYMVWLVIPFSVIISWMYTSLTQVGESSENPFEGSPNDIPISQMSRSVEIDLREMLGETDLPSSLQPKNNIIL